ncbi:MAG: PQQ-binding-like beta-propeller repeat protein [Candidatus Eisenbacteria bacterium]|nr:PQQ-binding-like beta-propeller repeat protein [Candidatus Latescibacterota bacterium]MBD3302333.1 PQQ-binding-like beta-propeller repeat protein [Candidatus Eisenbacteria bacterium]
MEPVERAAHSLDRAGGGDAMEAENLHHGRSRGREPVSAPRLALLLEPRSHRGGRSHLPLRRPARVRTVRRSAHRGDGVGRGGGVRGPADTNRSQMGERKLMNRHLKTAATGLVTALLLAPVLTGLATASLDPGPWPMFHRDAAHTGFTDLHVSDTSALSWTAPLSDSVEYSSPVVNIHGRILIGDVGKEIWSFDLTGTARWNYHTGGNLRYGTPAVGDDQTVYVGSADGNLYALWPSGTLRWTATTGGAVKTAPAIAEDGTIYVGSDDGKLYAIRPEDGSIAWTYAANDTIRSSPAVGPDGTIYFGSNDGFLRAVFPTGSLRWEGATGGPIKGAPAIYRERVMVGSGDGFLYCIDRRTGDLIWATYTGNNIRSSPAVGITGKIYVGVGDDIMCFHDDDGEPCFDFPTGGQVRSSPAVTAGDDSVDVVICGSDDGTLYAVRDGDLLWSATIGAPIRSSPAIGLGGFVYVGATDGILYAFGELDPAAVDPLPPRSATRISLAPNPARADDVVRIDPAGIATGPGAAVVSILDPMGRRVRRLPAQTSGSILWDGKDEGGRPVPTGVYWVRWTNGTEAAIGRVVRIR